MPWTRYTLRVFYKGVTPLKATLVFALYIIFIVQTKGHIFFKKSINTLYYIVN